MKVKKQSESKKVSQAWTNSSNVRSDAAEIVKFSLEYLLLLGVLVAFTLLLL